MEPFQSQSHLLVCAVIKCFRWRKEGNHALFRGFPQTPTVGTSSAKCRDPGLNQGPSDLQSDALPTELSRLGTGVPLYFREMTIISMSMFLLLSCRVAFVKQCIYRYSVLTSNCRLSLKCKITISRAGNRTPAGWVKTSNPSH